MMSVNPTDICTAVDEGGSLSPPKTLGYVWTILLYAVNLKCNISNEGRFTL